MDAEKLIEKLSQEQNESSKVVRIALAYAEFASLVKKMREAQKKFGGEVDVCIGFEEGLDEMYKLEDKVDEHLKKMEI